MDRPRLASSSGGRGPLWAGLLTAVALALAVIGVVFVVLDRHSTLQPTGDPINVLATWSTLTLAPVFAAAGWALASHRPEVLFGWLALVTAVALGVGVAAVSWAVWVVDGGGHVPGADWVAWSTMWASVQPLTAVVTWALFPTGRLPRGRIGVLAATSVGLCAVATVLALIAPIPSSTGPAAFQH